MKSVTTGLRTLAVAFTITLLQSVSSPTMGQATKTESECIAKRIEAIKTLTERERDGLVLDSLNDKQRIQKSLLGCLDSTDTELRCAAAYLLGEYRVPEAAIALSRIITLEPRLRPTAAEWLWDGHPVPEALLKIGSPSIPPLVSNLEDSNDRNVRETSLDLIRRIDGDKDITRLRLQKAKDAQQDPFKKDRLQAALDSLSASKDK